MDRENPWNVNAASWFRSVKLSSGLDDVLVPAIRDDSPQARRGFTVADQVNQLVSVREADPDRGFMARTMALCSLPRTNPGNRYRYVRRNGPYTLVMSTDGLYKLPLRQPAAPDPWPGCAPKRCGPKAVCWSWGPRLPTSCGSWAWLPKVAASEANAHVFVTRWTGSSVLRSS